MLPIVLLEIFYLEIFYRVVWLIVVLFSLDEGRIVGISG